MTRTQAFLFTLAVLLILYGVVGKSRLTARANVPGGSGRTEAPTDADSKGAPGIRLGGSPTGGARNTGRTNEGSQPRGALRKAPKGAPEGGSVALEVHLVDARTNGPSNGSLAELWYSQTGEGPSYRSARKVHPNGPSRANEMGHVRLRAPLGRPLEIIARIRPDAAFERVALGTLGAAPAEPIVVRLHSPPEPLEVHVSDNAGRPIPGASIRIVEGHARPGTEYTSSGVLGSRTGGDGRTSLSGRARSARWLLIDAPGYSPMAVGLTALGDEENLDVALSTDTSLELTVVDDRGQALVKAVVEVEFTLAGLSSVRTGRTNRQGRVSIGHLPADTPLRPVITPAGGLPQTVEVLESPGGEALRATLHVVQ